MKNKNLLPLILFLLLHPLSAIAEPRHAIAMFGEPKYSSGFSHFEYTNPNAPKGGTLKLASIGTFDNLNPHILKGVAADGLGYMYDTLMLSSYDEHFTKYGLVAKEIEVAADNSSVTFYLRPEARFHDDSPLTAEDVVFSFDILMEKGHPFYRSYYKEITKAEALDQYTVKFSFSTTENRELPLIIGDLPILPKKYYETHEFDKTTLEPQIGSGPYKIKSFEQGRWIKFERVKDYWAKDLPIMKGKYNFDEIQYDYYRDATVSVEAFKSGEYDLREENISRVWATAYDFPAVRDGRVIKEVIDHDIPAGIQGFVFNTRKDKFKDPKVREALNYLMDFEWQNQSLFYGVYFRSRSYFQNSDFAATGLPSESELTLLEPFREALDPRVFTEEYNPPKSDGSGNNREMLRKADKLLTEAGWVVRDFKRVNEKTGEQMTIDFMLSSPTFERVVAPMLNNLKKLGVEASMRTVDSAQYIKRSEEFDYDMIGNIWGQSNSPGNEQIDYWHSSQSDIRGSRNLAGIKNPAADAMIEKIIKAKTRDELITACRALDRVLQWGFYVIPNWYLGSFRLVYWNKFDRPAISPKYAMGLETWWINQDKLRRVEKAKSTESKGDKF